MLLLALSLACRPTTPPEPPEVPTPPETGPPGEPMGHATKPLPDPTKPVMVSGTWTSASCHDRAYERRVQLNADHTYQATDLVSPCPPDVTCIWSGVVSYGGTWAMDSGEVVLTEQITADADKTVARPTRFTWTEGSLMEPHEAGDCVYKVLVDLPKPESEDASQAPPESP